jgi:hypothetical protein
MHDKDRVAQGKYPKMTAFEKLMEELTAINLAPKAEKLQEIKTDSNSE